MDAEFYSGGLRFECTRCSNCCRHEPGYVFLSAHDLSQLAQATGVSEEEVVNKFCRAIHVGMFERLSLREKQNYDCIFWEEGGCTVYNHRPLQCKTYPFWSANLFSLESWSRVGESCPGVNQGRLYAQEEIEHFIVLRKQEPLLP